MKAMHKTSMLIDLYELTMSASYFADGRATERATFDLFVRRISPQRNYMVFAGLPILVDYIRSLHFTPENIDYLRSLNLFSEDFLGYLKGFKFSGQLESLNEGEIFFGSEPIIKVTAPLIEAQIIETSLINIIHLHSLLATKAARIISAANGKIVIDFGARRAHGSDAALAAAYASYLVGAARTSNVLAGERYGIPVFGTMAHSYIQSFTTEQEAFETYLRHYPKQSTLLIDTYDSLAATQLIANIARKHSVDIQAIRIDSGDLRVLTRQVRKILDENNLKQTKIIVSGDLDEMIIADFEQQQLPIDGYGVGTKMDVSVDAPYLEMVYKLSRIERQNRARNTMKNSPHKRNLPGRKQIHRQFKNHIAEQDVICLEDEKLPGTKLLQQVIRDGESILESNSWDLRRRLYQQNSKTFSDGMFSLDTAYDYPVKLSEKLQSTISKSGEVL
jgi:nicotinate phosphoribosyltransferase